MGKDMKITKVKTKLGELLTPVSTELEAVIERMRSDKTKPAADKIALNAMASRLAMGQGTPKHQLLGTDELPYLIFGATFGHGDWMMCAPRRACCCSTSIARRAIGR